MTGPDFSKYTKEQLLQVRSRVDAERFPDRVQEIERCLAEADYIQVSSKASSVIEFDSSLYAPILQRVGWVLLVLGLIDMSVMAYCIFRGISYSSSFNIFAVIAGIFLLKGSLRAASIVRWLAVLMFSGSMVAIFVFPFFQPLGLTWTYMRLYPVSSFWSVAVFIFFCGMLYWLIRELGREPIHLARNVTGRKLRDIRIPFILGAGFAVLGAVAIAYLEFGENAKRAQMIAQKELGPKYQYNTTAISILKSDKGTFFSGTVTAWNRNEIILVPVRWKE